MRLRAVPALVALVAAGCLPASWGASLILHPWRRPVTARPDLPFREVVFRNDGLTLRGWMFPAAGGVGRRGLVVYLHGIADNRQSGIPQARWLTARGYDVLAYDARAHGASEGGAASYGAHERRDVAAALDAVGAARAILFGVSYGATTALLAAADQPRVSAVVAVAPFADLRSIVRERAPFFASRAEVEAALRLAEARGGFDADDASAETAAARIQAPVLLIHGAADGRTRPHHSERIHGRLAGPRRLVLVPEAGHDDLFSHRATRDAIDSFLAALPAEPPAPAPRAGGPR